MGCPEAAIAYAASDADAALTMASGRALHERDQHRTIDTDRLRTDARSAVRRVAARASVPLGRLG